MDFGLMSATVNPSEPTIDAIMRDAMACANASISGIGNIAKAGANMYNAVGNMLSPSGMNPQAMNPYSANMGMTPQANYAYAEYGNNMGYANAQYLNPMTSQMPMGYPGFADPDYGAMIPTTGYSGFGGRL